MPITSLSFLIFVAISILLYYIVPQKKQWAVLLAASILFYILAALAHTIIFLLISAGIAYISTNLPVWQRNRKPMHAALETAIAVIAVLINLSLWFVIKAGDIWKPICYHIGGLFLGTGAESIRNWNIVAALGMGYYTLQIIGYILDCYWGSVQPQKNFFKILLFTIYFPQLIIGPISRYEHMESLWKGHPFSYENIAHGAQRILFGFFKKLVLAERAGILVNAIWANLPLYQGYWRWVALLVYPIQIYADFSGGMDIVLGVSELFGIRLAENFKNPFFSRTTQEIWQRWHITLGTWAKDYVLYPLLKSQVMVRLGKKARKKLGKRVGKLLPTMLGMFVLWMALGIWHGNFKYVIGVSAWYWAVLMLGELFAPITQKITVCLKIPKESFSWHLFQSARTYIIFAVGICFSKAQTVKEAGSFIKSLYIQKDVWNPWVFFDGSVLNIITHLDINLMIIAVVLLILVAILREKYGYARLWMDRQLFVFRWMVWLGLFVVVLIYGKYGPGYNAAEFIYQGF